MSKPTLKKLLRMALQLNDMLEARVRILDMTVCNLTKELQEEESLVSTLQQEARDK